MAKTKHLVSYVYPQGAVATKVHAYSNPNVVGFILGPCPDLYNGEKGGTEEAEVVFSMFPRWLSLSTQEVNPALVLFLFSSVPRQTVTSPGTNGIHWLVCSH